MAAPAVPPPPLALEARFGDLARTRGAAVALAGGLVLTAAHVVDEASLREELCRLGRWPAEPAPYLAGLRLRPPGGEAVPATRLRLGRSTFTRQGSNQATQLGCNLAYRAGQDLALLRPEHPLPGPGATICAENPTPGQLVTAFSAGRPVQGRRGGRTRARQRPIRRPGVAASARRLGRWRVRRGQRLPDRHHQHARPGPTGAQLAGAGRGHPRFPGRGTIRVPAG